MRRIVLLLGLAALGAAAPAFADDDQICADRPGKATSPCTVPAGHWQVETGLADWSLQKGGGERDTLLVLGETTVKYGLDEHSDIEVDVVPWQRATSRAGGVHQSASGIGDTQIIYKRELTSSDAALQLSLYPYVKLPTAKHDLGNGKVEGGLLVPIQYQVPKSKLSIGLTPELDLLADQDGHGYHAAMAQVVTLGWQASDKLNLSTELWGQWDWDPSATTRQYSADGAIAYVVNKNVQLDAGVNLGLNRQTPDVEIYGGISERF